MVVLDAIDVLDEPVCISTRRRYLPPPTYIVVENSRLTFDAIDIRGTPGQSYGLVLNAWTATLPCNTRLHWSTSIRVVHKRWVWSMPPMFRTCAKFLVDISPIGLIRAQDPGPSDPHGGPEEGPPRKYVLLCTSFTCPRVSRFEYSGINLARHTCVAAP